MPLTWAAAEARAARAGAAGFAFSGTPPFGAGFTAKPGSHDDGPLAGPFLGGIGAPAFSRDVEGRFDRWHLDPGAHVHQPIAAAFLMLGWSQGGVRYARRLAVGEGGFAAADRDYAALFPVVSERYRGLPFDVRLEYYSPVIPGNLAAATLPVTLFNLHVDGVQPDVEDIRLALFWPNLLGWRPSAVSTERRSGTLWPAHTNAGNHAVAIDAGELTGVSLRRATSGAETVIAARGPGITRALTFMAEPATTGVLPHKQRHTLAYAEHLFLTTGALPQEELAWRAHWHEPQGTALAVPVRDGSVTIVLVHDWADAEFGAGRSWRRSYAADDDRCRGEEIADVALDHNAALLEQIDAWHAAAIEGADDPQLAGASINEMSFVVGGGAIHGRPIEPPVDGDAAFGAREHFGLLEGYDTGYHFYNTSDLWVYAFAALSLHWPELADSVFDDYLDTISIAGGGDRPTYRHGDVAPLHVAGKIPHDLGAPPDDPWVRLNGYALRDDPNLWKDHKPAFVLAFLLHVGLTGRLIDDRAWRALEAAADFVAGQCGPGEGVPRHDAFGDSTWDNLQMRGHSSYAASLCAGMWAALAAEASRRGADPRDYDARRAAACETLGRLWNGRYFLCNDEGKYGSAIMADALYGLFYARLLGLGDLVPAERVRAHLAAVHRYNFRGYAGGTLGPLLVTTPDGGAMAHDGGQSLQVNEVLIGAAWMYVAMAREWGLAAESAEVARALRDMLYRDSGLQFRTPAAVDAEGRFRAPLNMRPLAVWLGMIDPARLRSG